MKDLGLSRREFNALTVGAIARPLAITSASSLAPVSASQAIERIKKNIGVDWKAETVDGIKAGDPAVALTGIVTTALASLTVLQQAARAKANLVITCGPTFYARSDARAPQAGRGDPVYEAKNALLEQHGIVVFRLSEHWRARHPDPFGQGIATTLGWVNHRLDAGVARYTIPELSLSALAGEIKRKLGSRGGIRVVGDPATRVRTVALLPGSTPIAAALDVLPSVDVAIAGEVREWESVEYARDVVFSGRRKGLVLVGRIVSEEGGMSECARWLAPLVPEVRVRHIAAGDPYWRPA